MKIEIQELLRDWEEEDLALTPRHSVSPDAIHHRVHAKMAGKSRRRPSVRKGVFILAACLVLAGSALAYTQYRMSQVKRLDQDAINAYGLLYNFQSNTLYTVDSEEHDVLSDTPHIMGVRPTYLPDEISQTDSSCLANYLTYLEEQTGASLLQSTSLTNEDLQSAYSHICLGPTNLEAPTGWWTVNINVFSGVAELDIPIIVIGENTSMEEGTFLGMEATWLVQEFGDSTLYNLLLFSQEYDCVIHVGCTSDGNQMGFAELEEIAEGLELVDTGLPVNEYTKMDWGVLSVARG